jgi:protein-cysteine N-palmitoyltransferase HHAT
MGLLLVFHPLLRRAYNLVFFPKVSDAAISRPTFEEADARLNQRASFDFGFAVIFLIALHGVSSLKVLLILYLNYQVATTLPRKYIPAATWAFNIGVLFANDICDGYRLGDVATWIHGFHEASLNTPEPFLVSWGKWLDSYGGIMSRWEILFNITVLRLISFNMDYYWSLDRRSYSPLEVSLHA